ncbi:MAG: UDP-glucose dehydrogenase family protein [Candidatus Bathyarchaeia archaeon]
MSGFRVSIIGTGHVGLVTAVCFAHRGYDVIASTLDSHKAKLLASDIVPFHERGLEGMLKDVLVSGRFRIVVDRESAVLGSDVTFIAVATPSKPDGSIDLGFIEGTSVEIGKALRKKSGYHLVVVKSTVTPGTTTNVVAPMIEENSGKKAGSGFGLCMNPEFLREGLAIQDTLNPDRVVIGELDKRSGDELEALYRGFYEGKPPPILRTNIPTAEMIKYASNAFLATKISFINQIAGICERVPGLDVGTVAKGMGLDNRISPKFLRAGVGYGGSCFGKDVAALIRLAKDRGLDPALLEQVAAVNLGQAQHAVELLRARLDDLKDKRIAILGLSFKPDTDDMREAPSVRIINRLLDEGVSVVAYDPAALANARKIFGNHITYASSAEECLKGADGCIIVTEWEELRRIKPESFRRLMRKPVIIDGRRIYDPKAISKVADYSAVGLGKFL